MDKDLISGLLSYEAPFLMEKLVKENFTETAEEAEALFLEFKRWLIIVYTDKSKSWDMFSLRIDEAWHQFILYSNEYHKFCMRFIGHYVMHSPGNAPVAAQAQAIPSGSFEEFSQIYESMFAVPLSRLWLDEDSVTLNRRVVNYFAKKLILKEANEMISICDGSDNSLMEINSFAHDAVAYMTGMPAFYVREIPGGLTDEEKVGLVKIFIELDLLRCA